MLNQHFSALLASIIENFVSQVETSVSNHTA